MNDLYADIGYKSINHKGEQLCGDHVDIVKQDDNSSVVVLADGLGSGVKASILSTLTSKIISTMIAQGLPLEECVSTIAATLPINSEHGVAYSTFTILHILDNETVDIIEYDNPAVIYIRDGEIYDYPKQELLIEDKKIYSASIKLQVNDVITAMSDGCPYASPDNSYNYEWGPSDIADFMKVITMVDYNAKTLATMLIDQVYQEYDSNPIDDATACVVKIRPRTQVNILYGPPRSRDDCSRMMNLFFSKEGKHIICGGTTSKIASEHLGAPLVAISGSGADGIPPISKIEGIDLVTEGTITINKVLEYAKDALGKNELYQFWGFNNNGAAQISRLLFEEATDIDFFVGQAINPAHQIAQTTLSIDIKMKLVEELTDCLRKMGKNVRVSYF